MNAHKLTLILCALGGMTACDASNSPAASSDGNTSGSSSPGTSSSANAATSAGLRGLAYPGNDPEIVRAVGRVVKTCTGKRPEPKPCREASTSLHALPVLSEGKGDETLVNLLGDANEKVRKLAASILFRTKLKGPKRAALFARVLDQLDVETSAPVIRALANVVGMINLASVRQGKRVAEMLRQHANPIVRQELCTWSLLKSNPDAGDIHALFATLAKSDKDAVVRVNAIQALLQTGREVTAVCKLGAHLIDDPDKGVSAKAAKHLFRRTACRPVWNDGLTSIENLAKGGKVHSVDIVDGLDSLFRTDAASPQEKARCTTVAMAIADVTENGKDARCKALEVVVEHAPNGKRLATPYLKKGAAKYVECPSLQAD